MITQNLHMHSTWDDGSCTMEEMILASKAAGLSAVGFSVHAPMGFPNTWECKAENLPAYRSEVLALREKYRGQIDIYLGVEWDTMSGIDLNGYDYVIGSAHQLRLPDFPSVDANAETTRKYIAEHFHGDADAAAEMYFLELDRVAENPQVDIVGHFDLLTKFDEQGGFFNPQSARYQRAALLAMEKLARAGKIFEVNTGAISRGYRTSPYPSRDLLLALREMGGRVTVSADAHHTSGVVCAFDAAEKLVKDCGFGEIWILVCENGNKKFIPVGF